MSRRGRAKKVPRPHPKQAGIAHSWDFTPGPDGGLDYRLRSIPTNFWRSVRAKAKRERVSTRAVILRLLQSWVDRDDPRAA